VLSTPNPPQGPAAERELRRPEVLQLLDRLLERVHLGFGRVVALYHRSSTSYQVHECIRHLCF
jgi:hypothetical protein